jgi:hypothetical protein
LIFFFTHGDKEYSRREMYSQGKLKVVKGSSKFKGSQLRSADQVN